MKEKKWIDLGEVVDPPPPLTVEAKIGREGKKMMWEGNEYDYVFSIDVKDDSDALKLPYNLSREFEIITPRL